MPLPKPIHPIDDEEPLGLIERAIAAFQFGGLWSKPKSDGDDPPRVGKYKADYSELIPEQIASDAGCEELFKSSKAKPIS